MTSKSLTFTVSLKMGGQDIKLLINVDESLEDVFEKLRDIYPNCISKKTEILDKLIATLRIQLQAQSLNQNLLQAISFFLSRNDPSKKTKIHSQYIRKSVSLNQSEAAEREPLKSHNKNVKKQVAQCTLTTIKKLSWNQPRQGVHDRQNKKSSVQIHHTPSKSEKKVKSVLNSSTKKSKCNPDLIKACQIIMKKVQNGDMKQMAKQFLKEKGYLKQEKEKPVSHKKKSHIYEVYSNVIEVEQAFTEGNLARKSQDCNESIFQAVHVPTNLTEINVSRQYNRSNKYKYLQSSLINDSLSKEYSLSNQNEPSSITKNKKYTYLE